MKLFIQLTNTLGKFCQLLSYHSLMDRLGSVSFHIKVFSEEISITFWKRFRFYLHTSKQLNNIYESKAYSSLTFTFFKCSLHHIIQMRRRFEKRPQSRETSLELMTGGGGCKWWKRHVPLLPLVCSWVEYTKKYCYLLLQTLQCNQGEAVEVVPITKHTLVTFQSLRTEVAWDTTSWNHTGLLQWYCFMNYTISETAMMILYQARPVLPDSAY